MTLDFAVKKHGEKVMDSFGVLRSPDAVIFGNGQRKTIVDVALRFGKQVLFCTDRRFAAEEDMKQLETALSKAGADVIVFDGVSPELPASCVNECIGSLNGFSPDVIVGIGGGSCLDLAKLVSLLLTHGGNLSDYYGENKVPGEVLPVIAVPTTAGTGSEVTPVAVLGDDERDLKVGISSPYLIPKVAICDPELTFTCPPSLTAFSGADALTHAIEAYTAIQNLPVPGMTEAKVFVGKNKLSTDLALIAIKSIVLNLEKAVHEGENVEARNEVMYGATMAGLAFGSAGTSAAHAIQYPVGAKTGTAHGLGVAVLLPFVMEFNLSICAAQYAEIARALGLQGENDNDLAVALISKIRKLLKAVGIPENLRALGVQQDSLTWIAEQSLLAARLVSNNPRELDFAGVHEIVTHAY